MSADNMILRSVHLPQKTDSDLRALAYELGVSKGDIIRRFIADGLTEITRQYGTRLDETAIYELAEKLRAPAGSDAALLAEAISSEIARAFPTS